MLFKSAIEKYDEYLYIILLFQGSWEQNIKHNEAFTEIDGKEKS